MTVRWKHRVAVYSRLKLDFFLSYAKKSRVPGERVGSHDLVGRTVCPAPHLKILYSFYLNDNLALYLI